MLRSKGAANVFEEDDRKWQKRGGDGSGGVGREGEEEEACMIKRSCAMCWWRGAGNDDDADRGRGRNKNDCDNNDSKNGDKKRMVIHDDHTMVIR